MGPGILPSTVIKQPTLVVIGDLPSVIGCKKVSPAIVLIAVGSNILRLSQLAYGIWILTAAENIAPGIIFPGIGVAACLVILPDQLVQAVIDVGALGGGQPAPYFGVYPNKLPFVPQKQCLLV